MTLDDPQSSEQAEDARAEEYPDDGIEFQVSNEFAQVIVRKIQTKKGEQLYIEAPKLNHSIRLDAIALESLTWQDTELFSEFLETPFGPGPGDSAD